MLKLAEFSVSNVPLISVIVITHKRARYLERALLSLVAQASRDQLQIIVVADLNDADTVDVCTRLLSPTDIFLRRGPCTPSESRNSGLQLASGRYVMFLDDDDAWHPGFISSLSDQEAVARNELVYFNCTRVVESRPAAGPITLQEDHLNLAGVVDERIFVRNQIHMSCIGFPRTMLKDIEFDPRLRTFEDWDYILAVFEKKMPAHVPLLSSRVFEVHDETTDRRSNGGETMGMLLDYVYVYRRHPVSNPAIQEMRASLLRANGISIEAKYL